MSSQAVRKNHHTSTYTDQHNVPIDSLARQIATSDFVRFTHILAADENNLRHLQSMKPSNATAEVRLWGSYLDNKAIPDPYYGGMVRAHFIYLNELIFDFWRCIRVASKRFSSNAFGSPTRS